MRPARPSHAARFLIAATLLTIALGTPASVAASCMLPPPGAGNPWDGAQAVFVGTVTALDNDARSAIVHVEEVWAGPDQPAEVVVRGGPEGDMASSIDRTFALGTQYIFAVAIVEGRLQDNACSGTTATAEVDLDAVRPADVRTPEAAPVADQGFDAGTLAGPGLVALLGALVLLVAVLAARRREA